MTEPTTKPDEDSVGERALKRWPMMGDPERARNKWHVAINEYVRGAGYKAVCFMYRAKELQDEVPRLVTLFEMERRNRLPKAHRQCSCQDTVPVSDNHLTCALGVECRTCPHLSVIEATDIPDEKKDEAKAWTCVAHILDAGKHCDTSEGMLLTVDDRMYWDSVYRSMAGEQE